MKSDILFIAGNDIDHYYEVESFLESGEAGMATYLGRRVGGCVLNAASVCASLGSKVKVLDILKKNSGDSEAIISSLNRYGVDTSLIKFCDEAENGKCIIFKRGGEKCIYVIEAKRPYFKEDKNMIDCIFNSKIIYTVMHTLKQSFKNIEIIEKARENGVLFAFDGESQFEDKYEVDMLLKYSDIVFINKKAHKRLCEKCGYDPTSQLFERGLKILCITDGENGSKLYTKEKVLEKKSMKILEIDSTGAGDSFAGSFLHFYEKGLPIEKCLDYATACGAYACTGIGGTYGAISEMKLFEFINKN